MERNGRETDPNQGQSDSLSCDLHCHLETCSVFKLGTVRGARAKMQSQLRLRTSHTSTLVPTHFLVPSSRPLWDPAPGSAFRLSGTALNLIINLSSPAHISSMWILLCADEHSHHILERSLQSSFSLKNLSCHVSVLLLCLCLFLSLPSGSLLLPALYTYVFSKILCSVRLSDPFPANLTPSTVSLNT